MVLYNGVLVIMSLFFPDDLEAAEQKCEQTKTELENTLAELSEI